MSAINHPTTAVIGVNYHTDDITLNLLSNLTDVSKDASVDIVVVDNSEREDCSIFFDRIKSQNPQVMCIKSPQNLGYFGGANLGLAQYLETRDYPDWLIVTNVDICFDQDFFNHLQVVRYPENVGVIAPSIWSEFYHCDRNPYLIRRPSLQKMLFYRLITNHFYLTNLYTQLAFLKGKASHLIKNTSSGVAHTRSDTSPIYAPQGALIVFPRQYFLSGGTLRYPSFLFMEEIFVAEMAREIGLKVIYDPRLKASHTDHVSTGSIGSPNKVSYWHNSVVYIIERYFRNS